ncbi:hypothetical protein HanIR_Chr16g0807091 [Helianthus annuus]|nr:hypothetical protein HanIR_Chr16g0807091 [Helianthus annuus]
MIWMTAEQHWWWPTGWVWRLEMVSGNGEMVWWDLKSEKKKKEGES